MINANIIKNWDNLLSILKKEREKINYINPVFMLETVRQCLKIPHGKNLSPQILNIVWLSL